VAYENPSGSFVHAALYAQLMIQVSEHLFPDQKLLSLSPDQRRMLQSETNNLLLQARWQVDSKGFADLFAIAQAGAPPDADPKTVLGRPAPASNSSSSGHYV
jgi:hypothetical protein